MVFVPVHLMYVVRVGGDWMPFGRFILPVVPLMVCLMVAAGVLAFHATRCRHKATRVVVAMAIAGAMMWVVAGLDHRFVNSPQETEKVDRAREQIEYDQGCRRAAQLLAFALPSGARLVSDDPGTFAYYTDAYVIDMFGLTTPLIAQEGITDGINPLFGRTCPRCYPQLEPDFFHVNVPIVRDRSAFGSPAEVISAVWQSDAIGHYVNFRRDFAVGRVVDEATGDAVYFLERRKPGSAFGVRHPRRGFTVEYPFEVSR
jgi:hypothetical protein